MELMEDVYSVLLAESGNLTVKAIADRTGHSIPNCRSAIKRMCGWHGVTIEYQREGNFINVRLTTKAPFKEVDHRKKSGRDAIAGFILSCDKPVSTRDIISGVSVITGQRFTGDQISIAVQAANRINKKQIHRFKFGNVNHYFKKPISIKHFIPQSDSLVAKTSGMSSVNLLFSFNAAMAVEQHRNMIEVMR